MVSNRNFIIYSTCKRHQRADQWLRDNHDPSKGNNTVTSMGQAIGYEHIQINTIRVVADTSIKEKSKSPKSEKLSASGNK